MVDIVQEHVERGYALDHAGFDRGPFPCGYHTRNDVEGKNPVNRILVGIDQEGDAEIVKLPFCVLCPALQVREIH